MKFKNAAGLFAKVKEEWEKITVLLCEKLVNSMKKNYCCFESKRWFY